jgi:hypothetical protein
MMKDSARMTARFEEMNGKFDAILEYVKDIPDIKRRVGRLEDKVDRLQADMVVVKFGLQRHSEEIAELKVRQDAL